MSDAKCVLGLPKTVLDVVCAVCADYDRRRQIKSTDVTILTRCSELNDIIDQALLVVDTGLRLIILNDVKYNSGYKHSTASTMCSPKYYYKEKRLFVKKVAQGMFLI